MEETSFKNNLDNIKEDIDLFGEIHPRLSVMDRVGFAPISIWRPHWPTVKELKDWVGDAGQTRELVGKKMALLGSKYTTSIFNPHLAQMIYSAYCPAAATIYDPFGGGGTRGFIAARMGHEYLGVEIRAEEVERIKRRQDELGVHFDIVCADSRTYEVQPESYNFGITCPPYFDLEVYSAIDGDMSNTGNYDEFLAMLCDSMATTFLALQPGSLFVMVVGNFRDKHGNLRHFSGDTVRLGLQVGFVFHDEVIFWGAADVAYQRIGMFVANRRSVRVHEILLIFKKP